MATGRAVALRHDSPAPGDRRDQCGQRRAVYNPSRPWRAGSRGCNGRHTRASWTPKSCWESGRPAHGTQLGAGSAEGAGVLVRSLQLLSFELFQNKKIFLNMHQNMFFKNAHRQKGLH